MLPCAKLRHQLFTRKTDSVKAHLAKGQCSVCGKFTTLKNLEIHHKVITMHEIMEEYRCGKLSLKEAKSLARSKENLCLVCSECHKKLHKNENYGN